jgi:hypothetical protein
VSVNHPDSHSLVLASLRIEIAVVVSPPAARNLFHPIHTDYRRDANVIAMIISVQEKRNMKVPACLDSVLGANDISGYRPRLLAFIPILL